MRGYIEFCKILNAGRDCWALRGDREEQPGPRNITVEELARQYIDKIRKIQPRGPYFIAGWSFGGILAFEMTRQLERKKENRGKLGIIDIDAPSKESISKPGAFTLESELKWIGEHFEEGGISRRLRSAEDIGELWRRVKAYLEEKYRENEEGGRRKVKRVIPGHLHEGIPGIDRVGIGELLGSLNRLRTFAHAKRCYVPTNRIETPLHYFAARRGGSHGGQWDEFTQLPVIRHIVPGTHFSIFRDPDVKELAGIFSTIL